MSETLELTDVLAGEHIKTACEKAAKMAQQRMKPVHFKFNDVDVIAQPGESAEILMARWQTDFDAATKAWRESPEYAEQERKRESDAKAAREAHVTEVAQSEAEMRAAKVPWPRTKEQLSEYIDSLVNRTHDYGTCVYALSMAAEAAFNYASHCLGVTGFQASCADLDFVRRTRSIKGPFMLIKGEDALYPQYDLGERLDKALVEWKPWLKEEAIKKLAEASNHTHPDVLAHWKRLAE